MKKSDIENNPEKALPEATDEKKEILPVPAVSTELNNFKIKEEYKAFLLENKRRPASVFHFARFLSIDEKEFYQYFNSLEALEQSIWKNYFEETMAGVTNEEVYSTYSVREKLLAFYFTWIEVLKENRSYVVFVMKRGLFPQWTPDFMQEFKSEYMSYVKSLINEGKENEEIASRYFISDQYGQGLWWQLLFVLNFWVRDNSLLFEDTDAAIEKAVNFSFDLMGKTALDSMVDLAKFLFKKW